MSKEKDTTRIDLSERLLDYGANVIKLESLPNNLIGKRIGDQLLRSGTSVGANYEEAQGAESKKDFVHKLQIALKELRESFYWLKLLDRTKKSSKIELDFLIDEASQLRAIFSKAVATSKGKSK